MSKNKTDSGLHINNGTLNAKLSYMDIDSKTNTYTIFKMEMEYFRKLGYNTMRILQIYMCVCVCAFAKKNGT